MYAPSAMTPNVHPVHECLETVLWRREYRLDRCRGTPPLRTTPLAVGGGVARARSAAQLLSVTSDGFSRLGSARAAFLTQYPSGNSGGWRNNDTRKRISRMQPATQRGLFMSVLQSQRQGYDDKTRVLQAGAKYRSSARQ